MDSTKERRLSSSPRSSGTKDIEDQKFDEDDKEKQSDKEGGDSSPARCPICLAPPENRSKSESCSHYFCYSCLKEWSKVKAECPLCKIPFRTIFHNIKSDEEFEEYHVKLPRPEMTASGFPHPGMMSTNSFESWWRFRVREYRAQIHRRRENELAAREASSNINAIRRRRMLYWNRTRVSDVDTRNRVRDISAEFFNENPSQMHRLEPWLKRELTVLYGAHNRALISCVRDKIVAAVGGIGIASPQFVHMLQPYLLEHTNQFVHEFIAFAKSPYDIQQFDRYAHYSSADSPRRRSQRSRSREPPAPNRNSLYRRPRSRWDDSPDVSENPGEPSSQSVMLSQTAWGDDSASMFQIPVVSGIQLPVPGAGPSRFSIPPEPVYPGRAEFSPHPQESFIPSIAMSNPSYHYSGLFPSRRFELPPNGARDVIAPLVHQTIDVHRAAGSSARQYRRMEIMRQHIDRHTRRQEEARRYRAQRDSEFIDRGPEEVIVISSDSNDEGAGTSSAPVTAVRNKTVLHYKPSSSQAAGEELVENTEIKQERSDESTTIGSSDSQAESDDSDIEFVKYIKPPHLRTPDVFIELSSTDDDAPGPSTRIRSVAKVTQKYTSDSSSSSSSDSSYPEEKRHRQRYRGPTLTSMGRGDPSDILQRTKEFLRKAKEAVTNVEVTMSRSHDCADVKETELEKIGNELFGVLGMVRNSESDASGPKTSLPIVTNTKNDNNQPIEVVPSQVSDMTSPTSSTTEHGSTAASQSSLQTDQQTTIHGESCHPKKVFERGKVSVNIAKPKSSKYYDSESDSDVDVGVEEVRPSVQHSWKSYTGDNSLDRDLPVDVERANVHTTSSCEGHRGDDLSGSQNMQHRARSISLSKLSEVKSSHHERSCYRSARKRKKKRRGSDKHDRSSQEFYFNAFSSTSDPKRHPSNERGEFEHQRHHSGEKRGGKHKSKKSHKKSPKRRKRSRSSSVEFVSYS